jgi:endonuclease YncB( thermonuclease family)
MTTPKNLEECTKENTSKWNFNGLSALGKVVSVYDGDTITIAFNTFGLGFFQHNIRLLGIDAPEMRGKSAEEKKAATEARDYLRSLVLGKEISFKVTETDKYGRLLASVTIKGQDVSGQMLSHGFAKPYSGGTREPYVPSE